jgi:type I restriction enzyme S subunit
MAAVDEMFGTIASPQRRLFAEVKKGYTHFRNGDVLFAKITPCMENGKAAVANKLVGGLGFGSTEFHVLRSNGEVLPAWLFYFVRQPSFRSEAKRNFTGTAGQQRVPTTFLSSASIPVPPLAEQRRLVDLLSRSEGIVRLRREAEKKAAELIPALFLDLFGDPATNPKGWAVATVGKVLDAVDYGSSSKATSDGAGLPMIRMGNVSYAGNLDLADLKYVDLPAAEAERYSLRAGDILFNRTNSKELVGKTGLWDGSCKAIVASYFIRLRVRREVANPHFLWAFMNTAHMKRVIFDTARGAIGQSNINSKELKAFPLAVPPIPLQEQFALRCADVSGMVAQQSTATAKAQATFDALLARSFS